MLNVRNMKLEIKRKKFREVRSEKSGSQDRKSCQKLEIGS